MSVVYSAETAALPEGAFKPAVLSRLFKTELCRYARTGCRNGSACAFAHSKSELQHRPDFSKTCLCERWLQGTCRKSSEECNYAHGEHELRRSTTIGSPSTTSSRVKRNTVARKKPLLRLSSLESEASTCASASGSESYESSLSPRSTSSSDNREMPASACQMTAFEPMAHIPVCEAGMVDMSVAHCWQVGVMAIVHPATQQSALWEEEVMPLLDYLLPPSMLGADREAVASLLRSSKPDFYEE